MKLSWNWIRDYLSVGASVESVAERLTMAGLEVKKITKAGDDFILETEITSNRPDWLSHIGVAREIAALFNKPLKIPKLVKIKRTKTATSFSVETLEKKLCPYYTGNILEGLTLVKTPDQMRARLEVCGLRSINFIVDVTNYVLLECGQPLHAFDLEKLSGNRIVARKAKKGEQMTAINGSIYQLEQNDCVIADEVKPIAIGGVMGGSGPEVSDDTQNILVESAYFTPSLIRKTSKRLKLASDSSYRFERGVDPLGVDWARERAVSLIAEFCKPSAVGRALKSGSAPVHSKKVSLLVEEVSQVLGVAIPAPKIKKILSQLGIQNIQKNGKIICEVPSFRYDISQPVDLIEEVARIHGYDQIPETLPKISMAEPQANPLLDIEQKCRGLAVSLGLQEVVTFSVVDPNLALSVDPDQSNWVRIDNPRNQHLTLMRPNFVLSMLQVIRHNLNAGVPSVAIFEVGNLYRSASGELPTEDRTLAVAFAGEAPLHWMNKIREFNFYHLTGAFDHIFSKLAVDSQKTLIQNHPFFISGEALEIKSGSHKIGAWGTIKLQHLEYFDIEKPVYFGEISLSELARLQESTPIFRELDKHPKTRRDLSLVVDDKIQSSQLLTSIRSLGKNLIRNVEVFDLFRGGNVEKGKKSISFRITYQASDRTLQTEEVNNLHFSIVDSLSHQFSAKLH